MLVCIFLTLNILTFFSVCVCVGEGFLLFTFMIFTLFDDIFGGKGVMGLKCERKNFSLAHSDQIFKVVWTLH